MSDGSVGSGPLVLIEVEFKRPDQESGTKKVVVEVPKDCCIGMLEGMALNKLRARGFSDYTRYVGHRPVAPAPT